MKQIQFNKPLVLGNELNYIKDVFNLDKFCGDGLYTVKSTNLFKNLTKSQELLLITSCTHALEIAALLFSIQPGDEVIMPSFTFVSTANSFVLRGAKIIFVDIRPDTMNIDENLIECAISSKTKAIVVVHYAGVSCEMTEIMKISQKHKIPVIEDAAQCIDAYYNDMHLGTIGEIGTFSFHETKNIQCGEGGAISLNKENLFERAQIIREKGTNRTKFIAGTVDKYSWVDLGSSYLPSELNAAMLFGQLQFVKNITSKRLKLWNQYQLELSSLELSGIIELPYIPSYAKHNGHIFFIKCTDQNERDMLIEYLKQRQISTAFHYIPLHSSVAGKSFGKFIGLDKFTSKESSRILRLPIYYDLTEENVSFICKNLISFYKTKKTTI